MGGKTGLYIVDNEPKIEVLGNYKPSGHECGRVMSINGIAPTIKENHGAICTIAERYYEVKIPKEKKAEIENIEEPACFKEVRTEIGKQAGEQGLGDTTPRDKDSKKFIQQENGLSNCLMATGGVEQIIIEPNEPKIAASRGRYVDENNSKTEQHLEINDSGLTNTLTSVQKDNYVIETKTSEAYNETESNFRIRKLTPKECWRLMGWKDEDFDRIKGVSNSQLYKQAGNAIVVPVLEAIFTNLLKDNIEGIE